MFVPRPETEVVVGHALERLGAMRATDATVVDLCSGSGAIALSLAQEARAIVAGSLQVHAVERDDARRGVAATQLCRHRGLLCTTPTWPTFRRLWTLRSIWSWPIPPYIPIGSTPRDPEVFAHDPQIALYSGADGLDHVRRIEQVAARLLRPGGVVVVEHADAQGRAATAVFCTPSWTTVDDHRDLTGRDRFVSAVRASATHRPEDTCAVTTV